MFVYFVGRAPPLGTSFERTYTKAMGEMSFDFPPELRRWIEVRLAEGRYADAEEYVRDLVRRDQEQASAWEEDTARVRQLIAEGEASGISEVDPFELIDRLIAKQKTVDG
jgi:antitoxin ParD1/3/4